MARIKAKTTINMYINKNLNEDFEDEYILKKEKDSSSGNINHVILSKLRFLIFGIESIDYFNCDDDDFEPYSEIISKLNTQYPIELNDKSRIDELISEISTSNIEREDYLKKNFQILNIISGYLNSDNYFKKVREVEEYLRENYFHANINPPINPFKENLILDLDETLIHSEYPINKDKSYDFIIKDQNLGVFVRNYLKEFLDAVKNEFNLILFSAGASHYVNSVIEVVGIKEYFSLVLSRECCCSPFDNIYIKDIDVVANFLKNKIIFEHNITTSDFSKEVIIVDNNMISFAKNLNNGILVNDFLGTQDDELIDLLNCLIKLKKAKEDSNKSFEFLLHKVNGFLPLLKQTCGI